MRNLVVIRDPVHEYIQISPEEQQIIDSPLVQRLRWIAQLSGAHLIYPSATHNRLSHVLGTMHLAGKYAEHLFRDHPEKKHKVQLARIAGLLHDIGHGPFSHQFDDTVYQRIFIGEKHGHDLQRKVIITQSHLKELIEAIGVTPKEIIDVWEGRDMVLLTITQGVLGADRLDFMLRDSYFAGTKQFGEIPVQRIIYHSTLQEHEGKQRLHYHVKILDDIFQSLLGRFFQYRGVYFHKASRASDLLITRMLEAAIEPLKLVERTKNLEEFQFLNDFTLIGEIMSSNAEGIEEARTYALRLLRRELPKMVWEDVLEEDRIRLLSEDWVNSSIQIAENRFVKPIQKLAREKGLEIPLYIDYTYPMSTINPKEFESTETYFWNPGDKLGIGKESVTINEVLRETRYMSSGSSNALSRFLVLRVFTEPEYRDVIQQLWKEHQSKQTKERDIAQTSY